MPKKKKDEEDTFKDYVVTYREDWDSYPVEWEKLSEEIIDDIPAPLFFDTLFISIEGEIEVKTMIYLTAREEFDDKLEDEDFIIHYLPEFNIRVLILR